MQTFVAALDTIFGGFRQRAEATYALLQADGTAFLVVAAPEPDAMREASYFVERLAERADAAGRPGRQPGAPRPCRRRVRGPTQSRRDASSRRATPVTG